MDCSYLLITKSRLIVEPDKPKSFDFFVCVKIRHLVFKYMKFRTKGLLRLCFEIGSKFFNLQGKSLVKEKKFQTGELDKLFEPQGQHSEKILQVNLFECLVR